MLFKPIDIKNLSYYDKRYVISSLIVGLNRVRQVGYGGIFKDILKKLNDDEDDLLIIKDSTEGEFVVKNLSFQLIHTSVKIL